MKVCTKCKRDLPLSEFWGHVYGAYKKRPRCKDCLRIENRVYDKRNNKSEEKIKRRENKPFNKREANLMRRYGIKLSAYNELLESQNGVCAICKLPPLEGKMLCVDHNHKTGKIRGLIHTKCNQAIAFLNDDPNACINAAEYLRKN